MGIYRLSSGRHRRFEEGTLCEYTAGDLIELDESEVVRIRHRIKAVGRTAKPTTLHVGDIQEHPDGTLTRPLLVFTPGDTKAMNVAKLKTVIANAREPAQLTDIEEQEARSDKPRVTVFRALARRRKQMSDDDDEADEE